MELQIFPTKIQLQIPIHLIIVLTKILRKTIIMKIIWNLKNKYLKEIFLIIYTQKKTRRNLEMNSLSLKIFIIQDQAQLLHCLLHKNPSQQERFKIILCCRKIQKNLSKTSNISTKIILDLHLRIYLLLFIKLPKKQQTIFLQTSVFVNNLNKINLWNNIIFV